MIQTEHREASIQQYHYQHQYEYVSFHIGEMGDWAFERPCGVLCESVNTSWDPWPLPVVGCPWNCGGETPDEAPAVAPVPAPAPPFCPRTADFADPLFESSVPPPAPPS